MRRRRGIGQLESRLESALGEAAKQDQAVEACERDRVELAQHEAAGDITAQAALKRLAEINERASAAAGVAAHRREVAELLKRELAEAREAEKHAEAARTFKAAVETARGASESAQEGSRRVAATVEKLLTEIREQKALRSAMETTRAAMSEACPEDEDTPDFRIDEAGWPDGVKELVAFLEKGPEQPSLVAIRHAEIASRNDRHMVALAVSADIAALRDQFPHPSQIKQLPEHLREEARELFERRCAENNARLAV